MKNIKILFLLAFSLFIFSCVDREYDIPEIVGDCFTIDSTRPRRNANDILTSASTIATPFNNLGTNDNPEYGILEGYVVSSDIGGNFYKSLSIVSLDGTRGFTIPIDNNIESLVTRYEPGRKVAVELKNLYFNKSHDGLSIGNLYENNETGGLSNEFYAKIVKRTCETKNEEELVIKNLTIAQAKNDNYLHKLIEFDAVQFTDESLGYKYYDESLNDIGRATNHLIADKLGNTLILRVSLYANFNNNLVPNKNGKIRGVLTKYNDDYQFIIRDLEDVKLTNNRITIPTIFSDSFQNLNNWTAISVIGIQQWGITNFGNPAPCAIMNGFGGGSNANEDWLISQPFNLTNYSFVGFAFETSSRFAGPSLEVLISSDYNSGLPSTANWTPITNINLSLWTTGGFTPWLFSNGINISNFTGAGNSNVRIAFKYTSTTSASATWEVDNFRIFGQ